MDFKEYKDLYNKLLSDKGRAEIGDDTKRTQEIEQKINKFLEDYPNIVNPDTKKNAKITDLSIKEVVQRSVQTSIDVIEDVSDIISNRDYMTAVELRRNVFLAFTKKERRVYIGIWCIFLSFILYFIDSAV